jgi:hypothetical protein
MGRTFSMTSSSFRIKGICTTYHELEQYDIDPSALGFRSRVAKVA